MVDALRESHRVLKPGGLLVDLRPAAVHRRVGFTQGDGYKLRWTMRENFDDDRAADRAVKEVVGKGWFAPESPKQFDCYRIADSLDEFVGWLDDFIKKGDFASHAWLVSALESELKSAGPETKIVISGPLVLRGLRKLDSDDSKLS